MSERKQRKVMVPPINQIFKYLQQQSKVTIWLYEQVGFRVTGIIKGFDEFMNVVVDDAVEISTSSPSKHRDLGRILLKGDNITLISSIE
ncbi:DEKNAAC100475 [Brettanomyces naardenensis]|uniref:Small nuclear ribonucleoprotein E n=1 Tax=Brettanomyces naardenensis TaxID=13370 RepID=A0A448YEP4_BRENA|nr:DEKNAAC100475 [Brettanomyces naardenensis]